MQIQHAIRKEVSIGFGACVVSVNTLVISKPEDQNLYRLPISFLGHMQKPSPSSVRVSLRLQKVHLKFWKAWSRV